MLCYFLRKTTFIFILLLQQNVYAHCLGSEEYLAANTQYQLEQDIEQYYSLIEESLNHRVLSLRLYEQLSRELENNQFLSASSLINFKQSIKTHLDLRQRLYSTVRARECWLNENQAPMETELRLKGVMLSLSAALTLYDNYLLVVAMFQENDQLRRIIDQPDMGFGLKSNELLDASMAFHSVINREKVKYAIKYYQDHVSQSLLNDNMSGKKTNNFIYLDSLIKQSPSFLMLQKHSPLSFIKDRIKFYTIATNDSLFKLEKEGINLMSLIFGNTIGLVESRKGKLFKHSLVQNKLLKTLKAGDILLEKTPFRLTDQFIPGYWGHAAIWIGSEKELKELGLWEHDLIKPWHKEIKSGHSIIEALRSGVELDPLQHFLNVDDMVVLRDKRITQSQLRQVLINAFRQLGKAYDFNFDISTSDRIVCSELVFVSYSYIDWPIEKMLGRYTISPDHIAKQTRNDKLTVVSLYLDGQPIEQPKYKKRFMDLIK